MSDTTVRPLPMTSEEITLPWLAAALRTRAPGVTVRHAEVLDVNHGTCTKIRFRLEMDEAGRRAGIPERVILKGGFEPHSRDMCHLHEREVRGYRDVFPVLNLPSPACYFADYNEAQRQGIVIMEDLVVRGVTFCSPLRPQTYEQVAQRLRVLARFHAQTWDSPAFEAGRWSWVDRGMHSIRRQILNTGLRPGIWEQFVRSPRGAAASVRFHDRDWAIDTLDRLVRLSDRRPHVILHGDAHLGNLYLNADGSPGFFDPMIHRDAAMRDVGYYLVGALDVADRRRWEGSLLQHYLDELGRHGVAAPSFDQTLYDYGVYAALGYLIFLINEAYYQPEEINTAFVARFSAAMIDHNTVELLEAVD